MEAGETDEAATEETSTGGPKAYDLGRQERIVRGRMPTLELINERFARLLRIGLFNYIHKGTEISVGPIKVQKYSEFIRNLVVPTNLNLVTVKPLRGTALMVLSCLPLAPLPLHFVPRAPGWHAVGSNWRRAPRHDRLVPRRPRHLA